MERHEIVLKGGTRNAKAPLQTTNFGDAPLQAPPEFLTSRQLAAYLGYGGKTPECSANKFTQRHGLRRYWRSQRVALVRRLDVDRVLQGKAVWSRGGVSHGR